MEFANGLYNTSLSNIAALILACRNSLKLPLLSSNSTNSSISHKTIGLCIVACSQSSIADNVNSEFVIKIPP